MSYKDTRGPSDIEHQHLKSSTEQQFLLQHGLIQVPPCRRGGRYQRAGHAFRLPHRA